MALVSSKKTIYQYYADKDELVNAVVSAIIKETRRLVTLTGKVLMMPFTKFSLLWTW
jgi:AcrR family transcriptional regulator